MRLGRLNVSWFCDSVQHCLRFGLDHVKCVKPAAFLTWSSSGRTNNVRRGLSQGWRVIESCCLQSWWTKKCEMVWCINQFAATSSQLPQNFTIEDEIDCLGCRDVLCTQSPWCGKKLWTYYSHLSPFLVLMSLDLPTGGLLLPIMFITVKRNGDLTHLWQL